MTKARKFDAPTLVTNITLDTAGYVCIALRSLCLHFLALGLEVLAHGISGMPWQICLQYGPGTSRHSYQDMYALGAKLLLIHSGQNML
jgi:hypothetical protein